MPRDRETVTAYETDKEFIVREAEAKGVTQADIVADMVEQHADADHRFRCPSCDDTFVLDEVDPGTVEHESRLETAMFKDARYLVQDRTPVVKYFGCPCCNELVSASEVDFNAQELDNGSAE
jgi:transcription elongation factor Elf1